MDDVDALYYDNEYEQSHQTGVLVGLESFHHLAELVTWPSIFPIRSSVAIQAFSTTIPTVEESSSDSVHGN